MRDTLRMVLELTKFRIAVLATMSTAAGYILAAETVDLRLLFVLIGTILLGMGSLALNQYQERHIDARMERTRNRPLASGRMAPADALAVSLAFLVMGLAILWGYGGNVTAGLGVVCVVWYNAIYTPLKRVTAFAVIPGSVIGAIPPVMGWSAAGGHLLDPTIHAIALFFFIWQVPHFWLLLHKYGPQYERAHLGSLTAVFSEDQLRRLTFVWIMATAVSCLMLPFFGAVTFYTTSILLLVLAVWLAVMAARLLRKSSGDGVYRSIFMSINLYALLVIVVLSADRLMRSS